MLAVYPAVSRQKPVPSSFRDVHIGGANAYCLSDSFSIDDMFTNLVSASSDWGDSIGCKKSSC